MERIDMKRVWNVSLRLVLVLAATTACGATAAEELALEPERTTTREEALDRLVHDFLDSSALPSLSVGVVEDETFVYARSFGLADRASGKLATVNTLYELGSVGKVFTATVLAILHDRRILRIEDPVKKWVPAITRISRPDGSFDDITLEHLATHTSGLPGVPSNVDHLPSFQWKGYSAEDLSSSFANTELSHPPGTRLVYSTLGMGLLGHILAVASEKTYETIVEDALLRPLGMRDTVISLRPEQEERYSVGYPEDDSPGPVPYFEYGVLAGGGAHRSTVADMIRFLQAQLGPSKSDSNPLTETVRSELHRVRWQSEDREEPAIALGWFAVPNEEHGTTLVHRGRTPGHGAVVAFMPERRVGVVLLTNRGGRDTNIKLEDFAQVLLLEVASRVAGQLDDGRV